MIQLTDKENKSYKEQKVSHICKEEFCYNENEEKKLNYTKTSEIIVITQENLKELLIVFAI